MVSHIMQLPSKRCDMPSLKMRLPSNTGTFGDVKSITQEISVLWLSTQDQLRNTTLYWERTDQSRFSILFNQIIMTDITAIMIVGYSLDFFYLGVSWYIQGVSWNVEFCTQKILPFSFLKWSYILQNFRTFSRLPFWFLSKWRQDVTHDLHGLSLWR